MVTLIYKAFTGLAAEIKKEILVCQCLNLLLALSEVLLLLFVLQSINFLLAPESPSVLQTVLDGWLGSYAFVFLGLAFPLVVLSSAALFMLITVRYSRLSAWIGVNLADEALKNILTLELREFFKFSGSDLKKDISIESERAAGRVFLPLFRLANKSILSAAYVGVMLWIAPLATCVLALVIGIAYFIIYLTTRVIFEDQGKIISHAIKERFSILDDLVTGIREVKVFSLNKSLVQKFSDSGMAYRDAQGLSLALAEVPRYGVEALLFCLAFGFVYLTSGESSLGVAEFGVLAAAGLKLMPSMQQIFRSLATIKSNESALISLSRFLVSPTDKNAVSTDRAEFKERISSVSLSRCSYSWQSSGPLFENLDMSFPLGCVNVITGVSGKGKSTVLDLIAGLLPLNTGAIYYDDQAVAEAGQMGSVPGSVSYACQNTYLLAGDLRFNITVGNDGHPGAKFRLLKAIVLSGLSSFVRENGLDINLACVQVSGGQRQRIGLARAIYKRSPILLLDEPTSALDHDSTDELISNLIALSKSRLIIMVSHDLFDSNGILFHEIHGTTPVAN